METFGTLYERVRELATKMVNLGSARKSSSVNAKLIDLNTQMKALKARMDKYGCGDSCYEFQIQVRDKYGVCILFKMVFCGLGQSDRNNILEIIRYRLGLVYGNKYELVGVTWSKEIQTGVLLPA